MLIALDMAASTPLYVQLRNQIVTGIGRGALKAGESLPTVRQLAQDAGVNTMTVNKAYQVLRAEGFIAIDRRRGATVCPPRPEPDRYRERLEGELELLCAEASFNGMDKEGFLALCGETFARMTPATGET